MTNSVYLVGLFPELDQAVSALDGLRETGVAEEDLTVLSGVPYSGEILGRPPIKSKMGLVAMISALVGTLVGIFLTVVTPNLYVIRVGGQPVVPGSPTFLLIYELTMLCLILGTFIGVGWLSSTARTDFLFDTSVPDGKIGILVRCSAGQAQASRAAMDAQGAESVREPERRRL